MMTAPSSPSALAFAGQAAIVTGAGRGLGEAIARALAAGGARVLLADLDEAAARTVADSLPGALALGADVADPAAGQRLAEAALHAFGGLHILVNNAGIGLIKPFLDTAAADMERVLRVNLVGPMLCAQAAARAMTAASYGRIVNVSSISASLGSQGRTAYGASKAGLELMTKVMALELAGSGITVNAVAPGPVETPLSSALHSAATREGYLRRTPTGRYAQPADIAAAVAFLASPAAGQVCGQVLVVDGGFAMAGLPPE